jgi:predicted Ser/Thr protein kinase
MDVAGHTIGHFAILEKIGEGGMGTVFKARDTDLGRLVAVKVLRSGLLTSEDHRRRVRNEARAASVLNHPNIVTIYEILHVDGQDLIVMEYIDGRPLHTLISPGGLPREKVMDYAISIGNGLAAAHDAGIIHCDMKPHNVLVSSAGVPKIVDFGLAKLAITKTIAANDATETTPVNMEWTSPKVIAGTAAYMSPEQIEAKPLSARTDVFSFGVMLYEMACGKRPFAGDTSVSVMGAVLHTVPDTAVLPPMLRPIVARAIAKDPAARYPSAKELVEDLKRSAASTPGRKWRAYGVAGLIAAGLLFGAFYYRQHAVQASQEREQIPRIEGLYSDGKYLEAFDLLAAVEKRTPGDPRLPELRANLVNVMNIETSPSGAAVFYRDYTETPVEWRLLGQSPLVGARVPHGRLRWKFVKDGFDDTYSASVGERFYNPVERTAIVVNLMPRVATPAEMVNVPAKPVAFGASSFFAAAPVNPGPYQIDRYEVTNREFKRFVDAGGYRRKDLWKYPSGKVPEHWRGRRRCGSL